MVTVQKISDWLSWSHFWQLLVILIELRCFLQNFYSELVILVDACLPYNNEAFLAHFPQIYQVISQFLAVFSKNVEFFFTENLSLHLKIKVNFSRIF